ncbi:MAG: hypothetical protein GDA46_01780 [Bdellovibrionales bacterium]|nr:hypothetical protein [Bdellovibrionales bacterium]
MRENNKKLPYYKGWEIKSHREKSNS